MLIYRKNNSIETEHSLEEKQAMTKKWMDNSAVNGPFVEIKESIGGYSLVKSESYEDAIEIAKSCPILPVGGHVEIRELRIL